jgi:nucleotide-binding universal stress UspA family protein
MGRNLSLLARLPRLEDDGATHRRDCECVRCDAGYRPTEHERGEARRRFAERRAREQAARVIARRKELERMKLAVVDVYMDDQVRAANDQLRALREARDRAAADQRLAQLWELRRAGLPLSEAIEEIERRAPAAPSD